jgi:hypothetical protein
MCNGCFHIHLHLEQQLQRRQQQQQRRQQRNARRASSCHAVIFPKELFLAIASTVRLFTTAMLLEKM